MHSAKVFVLDDDASVRRSLQRLLAAAGHEATACASAQELAPVYDGGPACLVLDLYLAGGSGLEVLWQIERQQAVLTTVFISGHGDVTASVAAMKHGAIDFLLKPIDEVALLTAVSAGLARSMALWRVRQERATLLQRFDTLTPRERQVCRLVAAGYLNKQTAYELGTAEKTVKVHRARVMSKLEVGSVAELVRFVDRLESAAVALGSPTGVSGMPALA